MTTSHQHRHMAVTAPNLETLLQEALDFVIRPPEEQSGRTWIIDVLSEVESIDALIAGFVEDVRRVSEEHDARVIGCEVSGVQETDDGIRAWGTVELVEGPAGWEGVSRFTSLTITRTAQGHWHLDGSLENRDTP